MILGYNTNGLCDLTLAQSVDALAEIGYRGVAITLDRGFLDPFSDALPGELETALAALERRQFRCVIETGARFLLDPRIKHEPTLVSPNPDDRERRVDFIRRAIDIAAALGADCVSLWSGVLRDGAGEREAMSRLAAGLIQVIDHASERGVVLGFEPEPGMFIDTLEQYGRLLEKLTGLRAPSGVLHLTIDVGHLHCQGETPIPGYLKKWADRLVNVHIEDMRRGVHEHLMFGAGEIDFPPVISALREIDYDGLLGVELSRHAPQGLAAARQAFDFLAPLLNSPE